MIKVQDVAVRFGAPVFGLRAIFRAPDRRYRLYMRGFGPRSFVHVTECSDESKRVGFGLLAQSKADLDCFASETGSVVTESRETGGAIASHCPIRRNCASISCAASGRLHPCQSDQH